MNLVYRLHVDRHAAGHASGRAITLVLPEKVGLQGSADGDA